MIDCTDRDKPKVEPSFALNVKKRRSTETGEEIKSDGTGKVCLGAAILKESSIAAVAFSDGSITVVNPFSREVLRCLPRSQITLTSLELNPDTGDLIAAFANRSMFEFFADKEEGQWV